MLELVAGVLLAAGLVYFVLGPVLRPAALESRDEGGAGGWEEGEDPDDDLSPRAVALRALKEIEFDRATGKLSDADYEALKARYTAEALNAMRAEQPGKGKGETLKDSLTVAGKVTPPTFPVSPFSFPACPTHGARPESDAQFCSDCGRRLGAAPGYCARCGASLEIAAQYCHACGTRVAA